MALNNVNWALYKASGIDVANVDNVAKQILNNNNNAPQVQSIDYSKFNRASQGIDLYSSRTDIQLQKQISLAQAGLYINSVNVSKLNSSAAVNLYSNSKVGITSGADNDTSSSSNGYNPFSKKDSEPQK